MIGTYLILLAMAALYYAMDAAVAEREQLECELAKRNDREWSQE